MATGVQAKMIRDDVVIDAILAVRPSRERSYYQWANFWAIRDWINGLGVQFPEKVIRAKCVSMVKRKVIDGCDGMHNCRGDFTLNEGAE